MTSPANLTAEVLIDEDPLPPMAASTPMRAAHPVLSLLIRRSVSGLVSIVVVAVIVYFATLVLPGDAATAILGNQATPARLAQLRHQLNLDRSPLAGFWSWFTGLLHGDFGTSLTQQRPVWQVIGLRLGNSAVLVVLASLTSTVIGIALGAFAGARRDRAIDHGMSVVALVAWAACAVHPQARRRHPGRTRQAAATADNTDHRDDALCLSDDPGGHHRCVDQ